MTKYFTALDSKRNGQKKNHIKKQNSVLRQAYLQLVKTTEVSDACTNLAGKITQIESAKDNGAYKTKVFEVKNLDAGGAAVGATEDINFYQLIAGYHQAYLCFPTPIATDADKNAYAREFSSN
jgi:hypothetical protein